MGEQLSEQELSGGLEQNETREYIDQERSDILEFIKKVNYDAVENKWPMLKLITMREINPQQFDDSFKTQLDWEKIRENLKLNQGEPRYHIKDYPEDFPAVAAMLKELFPNEFERDFENNPLITEKIWKMVFRRYRSGTNPSRADRLFGSLFGFDQAMTIAANIKTIDPVRFDQLAVTEENIEQLRGMIRDWEPEKKRPLFYPSAVRALRILEKK